MMRSLMGPADVSAPGGEPGVGHPGVGHPGVGHPGVGPPGVGHPGVGHPGVGPPGVGHPNRTRRRGWREGAAPLFLPRVPGHVRCTSARTQHPHSSGAGFPCHTCCKRKILTLCPKGTHESTSSAGKSHGRETPSLVITEGQHDRISLALRRQNSLYFI
ncbi:hypothetical protein Q9966_000576 [Columba livia]|nr:hypothetical protein Q9966_000576 [Columba livia]